MTLPPHCATEDEPVPSLDQDDGPDMLAVMPIAEMLATLDLLNDDDVGYLGLWRRYLASVGGSVSLNIDRDGERHLNVGAPCDAQLRHRWRWMHFLCEHMKSSDERPRLLMGQLFVAGHYADNRPNDPALTTAAIRGFLLVGGRILLGPSNKRVEAYPPDRLLNGTDDESEACRSASAFFLRVRRRWRSDAHLKRAVRMLGRDCGNGWRELAGPAPQAVTA